MIEVIGVRFKPVGKVYTFDPAGLKLDEGTLVIVETSRGVECGFVAVPNREVDEETIVTPLKSIVRVADDRDIKQMKRNNEKEKEAFEICEEKIKNHGLEMKLIDVEYTFDNKKILFYFTADGRVDFRELVKDLASIFKTRIELRQIGVRDEAKLVGGLGICGRPLCCRNHLSEFQPVSIKMAKEQGLSLNPAKISGTCGRLMCCLKYEEESYWELRKITPRIGSIVETDKGKCVVRDANLISGELKVTPVDNPDAPLSTYSRDEVMGLKTQGRRNTKQNKSKG